MSDALTNLIRREVMRAMQQYARSRVGTVSSYDPEKHAVKVKMQPEGHETDWMPIGSHHIGNGFGVMVAPKVGEQVEIGFQEGDPESPRVIGRLFSKKDKPPRVEAGEVLVKHESGSSIFIDKSGNVHIKSSGQLHINGSGETP